MYILLNVSIWIVTSYSKYKSLKHVIPLTLCAIYVSPMRGSLNDAVLQMYLSRLYSENSSLRYVYARVP